MSGVGVVEEKYISRDPRLTFEGWRNGVGREPRRLEYADTNWGQIRGCELDGTLDAILKRVSRLTVEPGVGGWIPIEKMLRVLPGK